MDAKLKRKGEGLEDVNGIASRISRQLVAKTRKHSNQTSLFVESDGLGYGFSSWE